ncbi:hypothetical protein [Thalassobellus citreus]|uniref:hypothetical protein n=1 Tax=Thalassobellus citreus TaxID=3367752 RepID=UPI0037B77B44
MAVIQTNFVKNTELNKLEQSLWLDFNRYSKIEYDALEADLKFTNEIDSVTYQFHDTSIIKETDTFHIKMRRKILFFDGDIIEKGLLDALKFETSKTMQNQPLFIFKQNDATSFIN